jgi:hypothetical protein
VKLTKSEVIRLAKLLEKDFERGRSALEVRRVVECLLGYQNPEVDVLKTILEESAKKTWDEPLVEALAFLFGQTLDALRFEIEDGYSTAKERLRNVRNRLTAAIKAKRSHPATLLTLAQSFAAAQLDLGKELQAALEPLCSDVTDLVADDASSGDLDEADFLEHLGELVDMVARETGGDPFRFHDMIAQSLEGMPAEHRTLMAQAFLISSQPVAVESTLGCLLDPAGPVRQAIASALGEAARHGKVSPTMLRRMIAMRNWIPPDSQPGLDAAIAAARRQGVSPAPWDKVEVCEITCTGIDGSGAWGVLAFSRKNRELVLGCLMLKQGIGVRDAWGKEGIEKQEIERVVLDAGLMDQFNVSVEFIQAAVAHFLAVGQQTGKIPPFGFLQFLESIGAASVQPQRMHVPALLDAIPQGPAMPVHDIDDLLAMSGELADEYDFVDSWFETGDPVDAVLTRNRASRARREALIMEKVLEGRREWWSETAAWMAYALHPLGNEERWREFYAVALALSDGRPLKEIAIMKSVAAQTVFASEARQRAA